MRTQHTAERYEAKSLLPGASCAEQLSRPFGTVGNRDRQIAKPGFRW